MNGSEMIMTMSLRLLLTLIAVGGADLNCADLIFSLRARTNSPINSAKAGRRSRQARSSTMLNGLFVCSIDPGEYAREQAWVHYRNIALRSLQTDRARRDPQTHSQLRCLRVCGCA